MDSGAASPRPQSKNQSSQQQMQDDVNIFNTVKVNQRRSNTQFGTIEPSIDAILPGQGIMTAAMGTRYDS